LESDDAGDPEHGGSDQYGEPCGEDAGSSQTLRLGACERRNKCTDHPNGDTEEHHRREDHDCHDERERGEGNVGPDAQVLSPSQFNWHYA
jgi:hypothetical protein